MWGRDICGTVVLAESGDGIAGAGSRAVPGDLHGDAGLFKPWSCTNCPIIQCLGLKERRPEAWRRENASGPLAGCLLRPAASVTVHGEGCGRQRACPARGARVHK